MDAHEPIPIPCETAVDPDRDPVSDMVATEPEESPDRFAYYLTDEFAVRLSEHLARARRKALADLDGTC